MLVLSRRVDEKVFITTPDGTKISVVVVGMERGQVRLGFDAPKDVSVLREDAGKKTKAASS